jgi:hypothetical protein
LGIPSFPIKKPEQPVKHFKEEQWNFTHRCPVFGPMTFDWSTLDYIVKRWNTRSKA